MSFGHDSKKAMPNNWKRLAKHQCHKHARFVGTLEINEQLLELKEDQDPYFGYYESIYDSLHDTYIPDPDDDVEYFDSEGFDDAYYYSYGV
jgi:hypothetical protein